MISVKNILDESISFGVLPTLRTELVFALSGLLV